MNALFEIEPTVDNYNKLQGLVNDFVAEIGDNYSFDGLEEYLDKNGYKLIWEVEDSEYKNFTLIHKGLAMCIIIPTNSN